MAQGNSPDGNQANPTNQNYGEDFIQLNKKGVGFAVAGLLYEILICFLYGFLYGYHPSVDVQVDSSLFISIFIILAIVGFGLINAYITHSSFSGMALSLLVFALTIQHFFLMRAFWDKAGVKDPVSTKNFADKTYNVLSFTNKNQDRGQTPNLEFASMADAIACSISMIICFGSLVGRIQILEVFFLTLFGSFFYELNSQLLNRIFITDIGFGMRVFLFGSTMGIIASLLLGKFETTKDHFYYKSIYASRAMGLVGLVIVFATFPMLAVAGVYNVNVNYSYITEMVALNMWLALGAGILGSFSISALVHGKIFLHDLVFSGLSGGIVYSSSSNLHHNPAVPLTVGFLVSISVTAYNSAFLRKLNTKGVLTSVSMLNMYLIPGFFSGVLSAILHGVNQGSLTSYVMRSSPGRSFIRQGGFQIIGILITLGIAIGGGLVIGAILKIINRHNQFQQFNDNEIYTLDKENFYNAQKVPSSESDK